MGKIKMQEKNLEIAKKLNMQETMRKNGKEMQ